MREGDGPIETPWATPAPNRNALASRVFIDELIRGGLRDVCVSPGSRHSPLLLACAERSELRLHVHVDERCAGFFALGLAKASGRTVATLCTSGTAASHYHPAVIEAYEGGVPLLVLSADRPARLKGCGAPQTTEQRGIFAPHTRLEADLKVPEPGEAGLAWLRTQACQLMEASRSLPTGPGPVHCNFAFDEPLAPLLVPGDVPASWAKDPPEALLGEADGGPWAPSADGKPSNPLGDERAIAALLRRSGRGVIMVGPLDADSAEVTAISALARAVQVPVIADPLSGLRHPAAAVPALISTADSWLRDEAVAAALRPAWILRIGALPTSKAIRSWMARHKDVPQVLLDPFDRRADPDHLGCRFVPASPGPCCAALADLLGDWGPPPDVAWLDGWRRCERSGRDITERVVRETRSFFEGHLLRALADLLPAGSRVLLASSMPVRDADSFLHGGERPFRLLANRGVNGIDGLVSCALGIAAEGGGPTFALLGDLAFLHDVGGLAAAARQDLDATLIVINNDGGAIFDYLPIAHFGGAFERLFRTPHGLNLKGAAQLYSLNYHRVEDREQLERVLAQPAQGTRVIEVVVDRQASHEAHQRLWREAAAGAARALEP